MASQVPATLSSHSTVCNTNPHCDPLLLGLPPFPPLSYMLWLPRHYHGNWYHSQAGNAKDPEGPPPVEGGVEGPAQVANSSPEVHTKVVHRQGHSAVVGGEEVCQ